MKKNIKNNSNNSKLSIIIGTIVFIFSLITAILIVLLTSVLTFEIFVPSIVIFLSSFLFWGFSFFKYLQNHERLQVLQMRVHSREQRRLNEISEKQYRLNEIQSIENTFFNMLKHFNALTASLETDIKDDNDPSAKSKAKGRDCFVYFFKGFHNTYDNQVDSTGMATPTLGDFKKIINNSYLSFYFFYQRSYGHYFNNLYNLLNYIDSNNFINKNLFASIVISQLSTFEIILIFYHILSDEGKKLKPLTEKFKLFDNISLNDLIDRRHIMLILSNNMTDVYEPISPTIYD
jgi:hypothetical protein